MILGWSDVAGVFWVLPAEHRWWGGVLGLAIFCVEGPRVEFFKFNPGLVMLIPVGEVCGALKCIRFVL